MTGQAAVDTATTWLASWDRQQESYIPHREARFDFLTSVITAAGGTTARVLDLGCGPGSLLVRLCRSYPDTVLVGIDYDPVLLTIAAALLPNTTLLDADLRRPGWQTAAEGLSPYDMVVSCTALHWLSAKEIVGTYAAAFALLRPGGLILNADTMPITGGPALSGLLATALGATSDTSPWNHWWQGLGSERAYEPQLAERDQRQRAYPRTGEFITDARWHQNALRANGFDEAAVIWRTGHEAIVAGRRP